MTVFRRSPARRASGGGMRPTGAHRAARDCALIFAGLLSLYLICATYSSRALNNDVIAAYAPASELIHHGTLFLDRFHGRGPWVLHTGHHFATLRFPGVVLWAVPFYAFDQSKNVLPSAAPAAIAAAVSAAGAMALLFLAFRTIAPRRTAVLATLVAGLATSTWSVSADQLWEHGPAQLALAAATVALSRRRWAWSGIFFGLAVLARPHLALVPLTVGLGLAIQRRSARPILSIGLGCLPGVAAYILYNHLVFSTWSPVGRYASGCSAQNCVNTGFHPGTFFDNIGAALVSPGRGLFIYTPLLLLLVPGLQAGWRRSDAWIRSLAVGGLLYFVANFLLMDYVGTYYYGYRIPLEALTCAAPLLLNAYRAWVATSQFRRNSFVGLVVVSVTIQALGAFPFTKPLNTLNVWTSSDLARAAVSAGWLMTSIVLVLVSAVATLMIRRSGSLPGSSPRPIDADDKQPEFSPS